MGGSGRLLTLLWISFARSTGAIQSLNAFRRFQAVIRCGTGLQVHIFLDYAAMRDDLRTLSSSSCSRRLVTDCL
jgi:hypothetical protein